jgi:hypothetical protein
MGYDANRPVPWKRLVRETVLLIVVGSFIFLVVLKDHDSGTFVGLVLGGTLYLLIGAFLSKFGYQRKTLSELREETKVQAAAKARKQAEVPPPRQRPAPTKRTGGGSRPRARPR